MLLPNRKQLKYSVFICAALSAMNVQPLYAAGPPAPSAFENPVTIGFVILMLILLLIIGMLANLLLGVAQVKMQKEKQPAVVVKATAAAVVLFLLNNRVFAQANPDAVTTAAGDGIAGMSALSFYIMAAVIVVELIVIVGLLINVKILLKVEVEKPEKAAAAIAMKQKMASWWMRLNSFRPVEQDADIDLGHDYDGIRELDNRLPPWWLYGFYLTIIVSVIYLYRFHVSHTGPTGVQEYETAVASADLELQEYLKKKGDAVDENTVILLTDASALADGKTIYMKSCVACHKEDGRGDVGPNLTDDYWLHGADVKSIFRTIRYGINAMPKWETSYSNKQIAELTSYIKSLKGSNPPNAKEPQGVLAAEETAPAKPTAGSTVTVSSVMGGNR